MKHLAEQIDNDLALSLIYFSGGKLSITKTKRFFKQDKFKQSPGVTEHYIQYIHSKAEQLDAQQ